ncbi:MAG: Coenzyme F420 hydrogenase/dehydrogenase, beta subunit C-terminal domain, partial [Methanobacterium sp.]|nr:Coenzyme F420 hydrogenase/dehydrogenase, beta subunit C-terminal domain [Methanobacterium sp.]
MNNIIDVVKEGLCTGCGTCAGLCPQDIIKMEINHEKGLYFPKLGEGCNECGICLEVCPGYEVDFIRLNKEIFGKEAESILIGHYENCYLGYSCDQDLRFAATSGGMITQILLYLLEEKMIDGALVVRMSDENPLEPEPFIARTKEDIINAKGSKYCPVPTNIKLKEIIESEDEKFAVVGLPCQIQGLRKAESLHKKLKNKIVLSLGIVCNHTPSFKATEFLLGKLGIEKEDVKSIIYRGEGWPGSLKVQTKNDDVLLQPEYWGTGFGQLFIPDRCHYCCDHMAELADMSFADPWLPEYSDEKIGQNIILSRKKDYILNEMEKKKILKLKKINPDKI